MGGTINKFMDDNKGPSWGGAYMFPKSTSPKDMLLAPMGSSGPQQLKNLVSGKGFVTDDKAKENAAANALNGQSPIVPPPVAPPVTMQDPSVLAAQKDYAMLNAKKNTFSDTIYAGDTGGYKPPMAAWKKPVNQAAGAKAGQF